MLVKLTLVAILLMLTVMHDFFIGPRVGRILHIPAVSRSGHDRLLVAGSPWLPRLSLLLALAVLGIAVMVVRM